MMNDTQLKVDKMIVQCLDAIVHHALLQDHPGVLQEQGIAFSDNPGDIYLIGSPCIL